MRTYAYMQVTFTARLCASIQNALRLLQATTIQFIHGKRMESESCSDEALGIRAEHTLNLA